MEVTAEVDRGVIDPGVTLGSGLATCVKLRGNERILVEGTVIPASNHASFVDAARLVAFRLRPIRFITD